MSEYKVGWDSLLCECMPITDIVHVCINSSVLLLTGF